MYKVEYSKQSLKALQKLDNSISRAIVAWIEKNLVETENPRAFGKALKGKLSSFWRYRIGDYRIISLIQDDKLTILLVTIGHRKEVYKCLRRLLK